MPQAERKGRGWVVEELNYLIDDILSKYPIDKYRIYVTGLSMGGYGTWFLSFKYPNKFAAIAPVCGIGAMNKAKYISHIPTWVFHHKFDGIVPVTDSIIMVKALQAVGAKELRYTELASPYIFRLPYETHDAWTEAYENPELYLWMLNHRSTDSPMTEKEEEFIQFCKNQIYCMDIAKRIRLQFTIPYNTKYGEAVALVGNVPELGAWDPYNAKKLFWNEGNVWSGEFFLNSSYDQVEFKYIVVNDSKSVVRWESGDNRSLTIQNGEWSILREDKWST